MKTNEIKQGTLVRLRSGLFAKLMDNQRGNIRRVTWTDEEGNSKYETSTVYAHDIMVAWVDGLAVTVEHTPAQIKFRDEVNAFWAALS